MTDTYTITEVRRAIALLDNAVASGDMEDDAPVLLLLRDVEEEITRLTDEVAQLHEDLAQLDRECQDTTGRLEDALENAA